MNDDIKGRLARFQGVASAGNVRLSLHVEQPETSSGRKFIRNAVVGTCLVASGVLGALHFTGKDQDVQAIHEAAPSVSQRIERLERLQDAARGPQPESPQSEPHPQTSMGGEPAGKSLRDQLKFVEVQFGGQTAVTPDAASRILLVKAAAKEARLSEVGMDWRDLYGIIHAETTWVARDGVGKTGTHSHGLAQFEPATAKGMNLQDPHDPLESIKASAKLVRIAAEWAQERASEHKLSARDTNIAVHDGVSVYYNLSWKGRNSWKPLHNTHLPPQTREHIANVKLGAKIASELDYEIKHEIKQSANPVVQAQHVAMKIAQVDEARIEKARDLAKRSTAMLSASKKTVSRPSLQRS